MNKLNYCADCKRIFREGEECAYCKSTNVKELTEKAPVNVIGTKLKGRVFKIDDNMVKILVVDENKNKALRDYNAEKLQKVL
jgi:hypothetical protein